MRRMGRGLEMKVFVCNDHAGWWPVPTASVVVAEDEGRGYQLLKRKLKEDYNIDDDTFTLQELSGGLFLCRIRHATILIEC